MDFLYFTIQVGLLLKVFSDAFAEFSDLGSDFFSWEQFFGVCDFAGLGVWRGRCFQGGFLRQAKL